MYSLKFFGFSFSLFKNTLISFTCHTHASLKGQSNLRNNYKILNNIIYLFIIIQNRCISIKKYDTMKILRKLAEEWIQILLHYSSGPDPGTKSRTKPNKTKSKDSYSQDLVQRSIQKDL